MEMIKSSYSVTVMTQSIVVLSEKFRLRDSAFYYWYTVELNSRSIMGRKKIRKMSLIFCTYSYTTTCGRLDSVC